MIRKMIFEEGTYWVLQYPMLSWVPYSLLCLLPDWWWESHKLWKIND